MGICSGKKQQNDPSNHKQPINNKILGNDQQSDQNKQSDEVNTEYKQPANGSDNLVQMNEQNQQFHYKDNLGDFKNSQQKDFNHNLIASKHLKLAIQTMQQKTLYSSNLSLYGPIKLQDYYKVETIAYFGKNINS